MYGIICLSQFISFRISVLFTPVERERDAFVREVLSVLAPMDVTLMTLDYVVSSRLSCSRMFRATVGNNFMFGWLPLTWYMYFIMPEHTIK